MSFVSSIMGAAGGTVQGMGSYAQGLESSYAYKYNARLAEIQSQEAQLAGDIELQRIEESGVSLESTQRMMYAKSGVMMTGSAVDVVQKSAADVEKDKMISKFNTAVTVRDYLSQAQQDKNAAKMAKVGGTIGLIGGLLQGGSSVASGVAGGAYGSPKSSTTIPTKAS
jgi:hypothetical protein